VNEFILTAAKTLKHERTTIQKFIVKQTFYHSVWCQIFYESIKAYYFLRLFGDTLATRYLLYYEQLSLIQVSNIL
jgi:hypothetical protein